MPAAEDVILPSLGSPWFCRRADVHKRLMLLASWSIVGPAVARIASWSGSIPNPVIPLVLLGLSLQ